MSVSKGNLSVKTRFFLVNFLISAASILTLLFFAFPASAATLSVYPATGNFTTQNNFTVSVEVNTNQAINGVEGVIEFPTAKLEVVGLSKSHSIMSLWIQEPSFSNAGQNGVVQFSAIKLNPGFIGSNGNVIDIIFRVKDTGVANVTFSSGSILANNGKGDNLLSAFGSAVYSLTKTAPSTLPDGSAVTKTSGPFLALPLIKYWGQDSSGKDVLFNTSDAEPKWNNSPYAKLTWTVPPEATGVASLLDDDPDSEPNKKMSIFNSQVLPLLTEGKHYFHIRFFSQAGAGPVLHFPLFIDLKEPKHFTINFKDTEAGQRGIYSTSNPRPSAYIFTEDTLSGLDRYAYNIDNSDWVTANLERDGSLILPKLSTETIHNLIVRAYDLAGNFVDASASVNIEPTIAPLITYYPHNIDTSADAFVVEGRSAPNAKLEIIFEDKVPIVVTVKSDEKGFWRMVYTSTLAPGLYTLRARQILDNGAESSFSEPVTIRVNLWTGKIINWLQSFNKFIILFIIFIIVELLTLYYYRRTVLRMRNRMNQQLDSVTDVVTNRLAEIEKQTHEGVTSERISTELNDLQQRITKSKKNVTKKRTKKI